MMVNIRRQAARSGLPRVPVILENHTKDITDFTDIEKFVADVADSPDVKTVTLTEIADGLRNGTFKARTA
jgi:S1-C subfamily serine protease